MTPNLHFLKYFSSVESQKTNYIYILANCCGLLHLLSTDECLVHLWRHRYWKLYLLQGKKSNTVFGLETSLQAAQRLLHSPLHGYPPPHPASVKVSITSTFYKKLFLRAFESRNIPNFVISQKSDHVLFCIFQKYKISWKYDETNKTYV